MDHAKLAAMSELNTIEDLLAHSVMDLYSAETQLLDRAFAALAANDRASATALVAEHARRFPNGLLRQERERARARLTQELKGD